METEVVCGLRCVCTAATLISSAGEPRRRAWVALGHSRNRFADRSTLDRTLCYGDGQRRRRSGAPPTALVSVGLTCSAASRPTRPSASPSCCRGTGGQSRPKRRAPTPRPNAGIQTQAVSTRDHVTETPQAPFPLSSAQAYPAAAQPPRDVRRERALKQRTGGMPDRSAEVHRAPELQMSALRSAPALHDPRKVSDSHSSVPTSRGRSASRAGPPQVNLSRICPTVHLRRG